MAQIEVKRHWLDVGKKQKQAQRLRESERSSTTSKN